MVMLTLRGAFQPLISQRRISSWTVLEPYSIDFFRPQSVSHVIRSHHTIRSETIDSFENDWTMLALLLSSRLL